MMKQDAYALWLDGGSLLLVADAVPAEQRQAVLDSLLYAQLVADKQQGSRFTRFKEWYGEYRQMLPRFGWTLTQFFHDNRPARDCTLLVPAQPLQLWLATRQANADTLLAKGLERLQQNAEASASLRSFACAAGESGTQVTLEVGLVLPGPMIHVCSVSVGSSLALAHIEFDKPLGEMLSGDLQVRGFSAFLDMARFATHAVNLRALIEKKQQSRSYQSTFGTMLEGAQHD